MIHLGADPEWFLTDGQQVVSAIGKIGGTKTKPRPLDNNVSVQEDNVAVEYNIKPASSAYDWICGHLRAKELITREVEPLGLKPLVLASHVFSDEQLDDPRAWVFGCEPDFDAWNLKVNPKPHSEEPNLRSAGGHIHVGYEKPNKVKSVDYVRAMDLFVGLPLMVADNDTKRMQLYGKAGAMRFKKYGFEYRTPSNLWTMTEDLISWAYATTFEALCFEKDIPTEVRDVINVQDKDAAKSLMKQFGVTPCPM